MHKPIKTALGILGLCSLSGLAGTAQAGLINGMANDMLYQETFPYDPALVSGDKLQDKQFRVQGWCGGNAGDEFCNNPAISGQMDPPNQGGEGAINNGSANDSTETSSMNINNDPQGLNPIDSFAFWSQKGINAQSFFYTEEFKIPSMAVHKVMWDRLDSSDNPKDAAHLLFLIDDMWYISDDGFNDSQTGNASSGNWTQQMYELSMQTFFTIPQVGTTLPGGGVPNSPGGLSLPNGQILAFGMWWDSDKKSTSRFDNFKLIGDGSMVFGVPEPSALALLGLGLAGLGWQRRRQQRRIQSTSSSGQC